jgi:hypothetical protein
LRALAGSDRIAIEQYKDFFSGRPFRRSLLVRSGSRTAGSPNPTELAQLHMTSRLEPMTADNGEALSGYKDARGRAITTKDLQVEHALARLADAYPSSVPLAELCIPGPTTPVRDALFTLLAAGQANISTVPLRTGRASVDCPCMWKLAQIEAEARQPWVTNLHHEPIALNDVAKALSPSLDGTRDRRSLASVLAGAARQGTVRLPPLQADGRETRDLDDLASRWLESTLLQLQRDALLAP